MRRKLSAKNIHEICRRNTSTPWNLKTKKGHAVGASHVEDLAAAKMKGCHRSSTLNYLALPYLEICSALRGTMTLTQ